MLMVVPLYFRALPADLVGFFFFKLKTILVFVRLCLVKLCLGCPRCPVRGAKGVVHGTLPRGRTICDISFPSMVSPLLLLPFLSAQAGLCLGMTYSGFGICLATFLVWKRKQIFLGRVCPEGFSHSESRGTPHLCSVPRANPTPVWSCLS